MKELLIAFAIALVVGSIMNGSKGPGGTLSGGGGEPQAQAQSQGSIAASVGQQLIQEVDEGLFQGYVLDAKEPVLVEFYTDECTYCRTMAPIVGTVAYNGQNIVRVCKINADKCESLADRYGVSGVPAFLLFKQGQLSDTANGAMSETDMFGWLARHDVNVPATLPAKAGT